jgi:hypothetical protein
MVSEPFIFLSSDRMVDVRYCKVKGIPFFCVKDFIRRTSSRPMGPLDALQYWVNISLCMEHEYDVMNTYVYKFPGPYEKPEVCIAANGLLIVLHHLDTVYGLTNQTYRSEINARLTEVLEGAGEQYMEEHDDGEIDAQLTEIGETCATTPPDNSRFWYTPTVKVENVDEEVTMEEAVRIGCEENRSIRSTLAKQTDELRIARRDAASASNYLNGRIQELEQSIEHKYNMDNAFKLTALVQELGIEVRCEKLNPLCKRVVKQFRSEHPGASIVSRKGVLFFMPGEKAEVERLLRQEHMRMELEIAESEHYVNGGETGEMEAAV